MKQIGPVLDELQATIDRQARENARLKQRVAALEQTHGTSYTRQPLFVPKVFWGGGGGIKKKKKKKKRQRVRGGIKKGDATSKKKNTFWSRKGRGQ